MKNPTRQSHRLQVMYPERRRERRYVTLKNAAIAGIIVVVVFLGVSAWSAFRPNSNASGNLFRPRTPASDSIASRRDPIVVREGSTNATPETNAVLLEPGALDRLRPAAPLPPATRAPSTTAEEMNFEHRTSQLGKGKRITISGGSEGIQVHAEPQPTSPPR
jgi:hypothetical protein